ncbi:hypothetical protein BV20DRAFT_163549 [Pilatotrama ljubarskyi]|nr:hypothetical protein BV20DRAFT_163549 [Pilatotrama ljubarskyi]
MAAPMSQDAMPELYDLAARLKLLLPPLLSMQRSSWEQGICAQAMLECHRFLRETAVPPDALSLISYDFVQWLYSLAHDSLVRQSSDGRLSVLLNGDGTSDAGALDPACVGETLYYLCSLEAHSMTLLPSPEGAVGASLLDGVTKMLQYILERCPRASAVVDGGMQSEQFLLSHRTDAVEIWSDSVYMLSPFLASAAAYRTLSLAHPLSAGVKQPSTPRALMEMALQQVILAADVLQSPTGEWCHIYDLEKREFKRAAFWGVGNGWVCCGIIRILSTLVSPTTLPPAPYVDLSALGLDPDGNGDLLPLLKRVYDILLTTLRACLRHMLPSSLFRNVLDDSHSFTETNLAQMLACTLYRLLDLHLHSTRFRALGLPAPAEGELEEWARSAYLMHEAAVLKTDRWGFVRDVCGSPTFDRPGTAAEGQAWGVLMEVAKAQYMHHRNKDFI